MQIAIIAEYNPLHNGHAYQIGQVRRAFGEDACITVILGGIFSQRGAPYMAPPYIRAEAAVHAGADLVLELPFPFSAAPASIFARAGVEIAVKMGADVLAFGSECGNTETLDTVLTRLDSSEMQKALTEALQSAENAARGKTRLYPLLYKELYGEDVPSLPNDILALEYLRAIRRMGASIKPYTVKRIGDYKSGAGGFASATALRNAYAASGIAAFKGEMPDAAYALFQKAAANGLLAPDIEKLASAVLLKLHDTAEDADIAFSGGGLLARLRQSATEASSIAEVSALAATKRYTDAEIARCLLYMLLSVTRADLDAPVHYTRLLATSKRGRSVLRKKHPIEILTKPSATDKLSDAARTQYAKTFAAERAYALCLDGAYDHMRQSPKIPK